jgi:hypothetical protein
MNYREKRKTYNAPPQTYRVADALSTPCDPWRAGDRR